MSAAHAEPSVEELAAQVNARLSTSIRPKRRPTEQLAKANRSAVMAIRSAAGSFSPPKELILLAEGFQQLQNARHRADYDGNYDPVRAVTVGRVLDAEAAVHAAREMWRAGETGSAKNVHWRPSYECFLRLALLKSGGPRGR